MWIQIWGKELVEHSDKKHPAFQLFHDLLPAVLGHPRVAPKGNAIESQNEEKFKRRQAFGLGMFGAFSYMYEYAYKIL